MVQEPGDKDLSLTVVYYLQWKPSIMPLPLQLDGPAATPQNLFFSGLPQEPLMSVFSKLFPLKTLYAECFECCEAKPILDSFEVFFIVVGGGMQIRDHLG